MQRIVIIGAGLTGACLAWTLSRRGAAVTVIDAEGVASQASGRSFGWINASFFHSPAHFNLRREGIEAHHRLDRDLGQTGTIWSGCLWWEKAGAEFDAHAAALAALDYPLQSLTAADFAARAPAVVSPPSQSLFCPCEGAVDAAHLTRRLLSAAATLGAVSWLGCPVLSIRTSAYRATGVQTAQGVVDADHVIIAAGTGAPALLAPLGLNLPMLQRPGLILHTCPAPPMIGPLLASPEQELRQDRDGRIIAPVAANHQADQSATIPDPPQTLAEAALTRIKALLDAPNLKLERVTQGFRPVPDDTLPVIGPAPVQGVSVAVMHSGVTLAPIVADLLAAEIMSDDVSPLLADFRPARFF